MSSIIGKWIQRIEVISLRKTDRLIAQDFQTNLEEIARQF